MNSKQPIRDEKDRISSLPDELLRHILSFLPSKFAVATSILATRWRYILDEIKLNDYGIVNRPLKEIDSARVMFMQLVYKVLMGRTLPTIREIPKFTLVTSTEYDNDFMRQIILVLLDCNIRKLSLHVFIRKSDTVLDHLFRCEFLEVLELSGVLQIKVPESFILPKLKAIKLRSVEFNGGSSINKLLSGCPILEYLWLSVSLCEEVKLELCHPLLKNLTLLRCSGDYSVLIDTPNLQNLFYILERAYEVEVKNMRSLVHAHISWGSTREQSEQLEREDFEKLSLDSLHGTNFINMMNEARFLYLEGSSLNALHFSNGRIATFQNLTILELGSRSVSGWLVLPQLFESTPNLKVLAFYEGFLKYQSPGEGVDYYLPDSVPACFRGSLEEIKVGKFKGYECELVLVEYFLQRVENLKQMMIGSQVSTMSPFPYNLPWPAQWPHEEVTPEWLVPTSERLSAVPRCSKACQIILTWPAPKKYSQKIL